MQAIIFCGIQARGKSTFYQRHFFHSHVRISMDLLRTRHRERVFLQSCLQTRQRFVVDNTNPTVAERALYVGLAKAAGYEVLSYFFACSPGDAVLRNSLRPGKQCIPAKGIYGTQKRLLPPTYAEGFDGLYQVRLKIDGGFEVREWVAREETPPNSLQE